MSERISFEIKALQSDATTPIPNAEIQLENINLGQKYKTNDNGIASFEIESTQHLKSFRAKLIHKDYQEYPIADRPITLNSIRRREKPLELRFREKIWLLFNGESLSIMSGKDKILKNYVAFSGKALNPQEAKSLQQESNYTRFVTYTDKGLFSDEILYFCLDKDYQKDKDKGAMPEGIYYININDINTRWTIFSENTFGKNTKIYTNKDCTNTIESTTNRDNFYLHGGDKYGNAGGIDLAKEDTSFFNYLSTLKATHICDNIYATKEEKCVLKLVVEYENAIPIDEAIEKLRNELYLIEAGVALFAKEAFQNAYVRENYNKSIKEMSNQLLKEVEKEQDIHKRKILAKQLAQDANKFRNEIMNDMRAKSTTWGRVRAERIKSRGKTFEEMIEKKIKDLSYNKPFEQLTKQEQTKVFEEIIESSGKSNEKVNAKISMVKNFARGIIVFSIGYLIYDLYVSENKARVIISHSATIGGGFVGGGLGMWAGLICGPYAFVCVPTFGGLGVVGGGYLGHTVVNEWFDDEINALLKEYNLD